MTNRKTRKQQRIQAGGSSTANEGGHNPKENRKSGKRTESNEIDE
ncbi:MULTISPECIES: hypothetical protein [Clostridium]|nr:MULTISPECIES: hypothetical protein [Clostridium]